jgi:hypothetical protein
MDTDAKDRQKSSGSPQGEWITRLEIWVYPGPCVGYDCFDRLQLRNPGSKRGIKHPVLPSAWDHNRFP